MHARYHRLWVVCLLAIVAISIPRYAYALDRSDWGIGWGPNVVPGPAPNYGGGGGGHPIETPGSSGGVTDDGAGTPIDGSDLNGVLVIAPSKYAAALIVCGVSNDDSRLTSEVRMKLSNANYGGEFYEFAQLFNSLDTYDGVPDFYGASASGYTQQIGFQSSCVRLGKLYGKSNIQACLYTNQQFALAKRDLFALFEDSESGDEGGVEEDGTYTFIPVQHVAPNPPSGLTDIEYFAVPVAKYNQMKQFVEASSPEQELLVYCSQLTARITSIRTDSYALTNDNRPYCYKWNVGNYMVIYGAVTINARYQELVKVIDNKKCLIVDPPNIYTGNMSVRYDDTYPVYYSNNGNGGTGGGESGPVEGDWPEDDGTTDSPTPPTLPEPGDPTIPNPPDPTTPQPDPTPTPKPDPTGPSLPSLPDIEGGDTYTADLQGILDAMDEHCIHIQTCLNSNFSSLNTYLGQIASVYTSAIVDAIYNVSESEVSAIGIARDDITQNIRNQVGWLGMDIDGNFQNLLEYLNDLWEWLEETLVFDFSGDNYDDSSLVSWLQKIYDKMGQGISTQPVDVVVDPTGTGSWIDQFLATFFGNLLGNLAGVLADAAGTMATLTTKFPLSLPWDIAAILGLLVAPPVCPAFEFPCYSLTSSGLEQVGSYDVDLHDVEFAVEGIRWMMRLGFVLVLARHTKDFLELIERVID